MAMFCLAERDIGRVEDDEAAAGSFGSGCGAGHRSMGPVGAGILPGAPLICHEQEKHLQLQSEKSSCDRQADTFPPHHANDACGWWRASRFHTALNDHNERMLPRRRRRLPIERPDRLSATPKTVLWPITSTSDESMLLPPTIIRTAPDASMPARLETYRRPTAGLGESLRIPLTTRRPGAIDKEGEICGYYALRRDSPRLR